MPKIRESKNSLISTMIWGKFSVSLLLPLIVVERSGGNSVISVEVEPFENVWEEMTEIYEINYH